MQKNYFTKDQEAYWITKTGERRCRSVHFGSQVRFKKARKEAHKLPVEKAEVADCVNKLLHELGVPEVENPEMNPAEIDYQKIKAAYHLQDERDLIWIKLTEDGFVGVVAQGADINFNFPPDAEAYNDKDKSQRWKYNTSGIIVHSLGKCWDTSAVLVFPLRLDAVSYDRHQIETAVGNYLIDRGVPILDYYSHLY